jgi:outer membrane protein OmpA-like peptidoglycan-associated protein
MQRSIIIIGLCACLAAGTANADSDSSKEETIGVGLGATIGAVSGGPVGAIIGAAIGAKFGDNYHRKNEQVADLRASLDDSGRRVSKLQVTVGELNEDLSSLGSDLQRMRALARPELLSLLKAGIEMDLLFRTDEHVLSDMTRQRLEELAASLAAMPDVKVRLDGFADERGDAVYNGKLSARRAEHVRDLLSANGIDAARISVAAHGESAAAEATADSYALERKVSMTLFVEDTPSFASNPE